MPAASMFASMNSPLACTLARPLLHAHHTLPQSLACWIMHIQGGCVLHSLPLLGLPVLQELLPKERA